MVSSRNGGWVMNGGMLLRLDCLTVGNAMGNRFSKETNDYAPRKKRSRRGKNSETGSRICKDMNIVVRIHEPMSEIYASGVGVGIEGSALINSSPVITTWPSAWRFHGCPCTSL
jgi:hypothetical protein